MRRRRRAFTYQHWTGTASDSLQVVEQSCHPRVNATRAVSRRTSVNTGRQRGLYPIVLCAMLSAGVALGPFSKQTHGRRRENEKSLLLDFGCGFSGWYDFGKIVKTLATGCHFLKLKCTKFDFGWGSAPDPAGGGGRLAALPQTPSSI